jgi:APA family basic amino acid/polyamine antiporter
MRPLRTSDSATAPVKTLGLWACVSLVAGNIIGSGIFLLPSSLAPYGTLAVAGWLVTAAGAICLALVFARLSRMMPAAGGPYAYTRAAFGDFMGFWVAWGYWIALWTGNAAIAVALGRHRGGVGVHRRERARHP